MQCPTCEFYNMPGSADCGRCGSTLRANALAIDVQPPRAAASAKFWRRFFPGRVAYRLRDEARQLRRDVGRSVDRVGFTLPTTGALWRLIVPGWSLMHVGERRSGRIFLGAWAVLILLSFVFFGSVFGNLCLGLAFGVHVGSCLAVFRRGGQSAFSARIAVTLASAAAILALYFPIGFSITRVAMPYWFNYAAGPFQPGDVLLSNSLAYTNSTPQPGDLVLYRLGGVEMMDRVLAGPGDTARWNRRSLTVNGVVSPHQSLNPERLPDGIEWTVPDGYVLVLPTMNVQANYELAREFWRGMGLVRVEDIEGKIYFRTQPLSRWGRIR
jgi:hypothetical protein